jgi:spore coat polysaccharide biosynthesis protein SpsF
MRVVGVVQARTGSSRLPGKVLADLCGAPLLVRLLERLSRASRLDDVIVATSDRPGDDAVAELAAAAGVACFRGSEQDVLGRLRGAAEAARADVTVRITGDCPLVDGPTVDRVVAALDGDADYASNVLRRTFPRGLDAEALHADVLARLDRMATSDAAREHVTWLAYRERPELFVLRSVEHGDDHSALDWSVDTAEDLDRVRALYERFDLARREVPWTEIAAA